jgi:preprotein translocase subunit SecA
MEEDTEVSLEYDREKLYYNMVGCKANWLYELPEWDNLLSAEVRKDLYKKQKASGTYVREGKKIGRNDPCPCGSGKKYKQCCGR